MPDPLTAVRTRGVPQTEQADILQVRNNAGGYTFEADWKQRLTRFLVLGTWGGTYYASEKDHTAQAAQAVREVVAQHGLEAVQLVVDISLQGRAPKQQPTMFALAVAASAAEVETRRAALAALPVVCRTGTHLFLFARYVEQFRGWGRGLRGAVGDWYLDKDVDALAFQVVKYQQREGWSHRDLLRLAHPMPSSPEQDRVFRWTVGKDTDGPLPEVITGLQVIRTADSPAAAAAAITQYQLPWEAVPSEFLTERAVWEALLPHLPVGATLRQLPRLTRLDLLRAGQWRDLVARRLTDADTLRRGRVHPLNVLNALMAYRGGNARSGGEFTPSTVIVDALDAAFYASFGAVTPIGRPVRLALDVSGSMGWGTIAGTAITPAQATAALALVTAATEPDYEIVAFSHELVPVAVSPRQRLDDVIRALDAIPMGGTDCALPMVDALKRKREVDLFAIYTDNETWAGKVHPHQALADYRLGAGRPDARCVVVGMTATNFTIAAPGDRRMLDVVGFDLATPELIGAFGRGEI